MADEGNRTAEHLARRHDDEIGQLFDIVNRQAEQIYQLQILLFEAKLGPEPEEPEKAETSEETAEQRAEAERQEKLAALKAQMEELQTPKSAQQRKEEALARAAKAKPVTPQQKEAERMAKRREIMARGK